ncbi:MAG: hypothetical protein RR636_11075 [Clostridium sp.]|uniref:hypothetical protein n=1 Tax=Clostridium sp. TaxID=1506 RepID=UPI0030708719
MDVNLIDILDKSTLEEVDNLITEAMEFQCDEVTKDRIKFSVNKKMVKGNNVKKSRKTCRRYGMLVAGLAIIIGMHFIYKNWIRPDLGSTYISDNSSKKGEYTETADVGRSGIIYNGKLYYQSGFVNNTGEYYDKLVGEFIGYPDKVTNKTGDKYDIEYNNIIKSNETNQIFRVKGYEETFRICIPEIYRGVDVISIFENLDYKVLGNSSGSDLYEERLALKDNIVGVRYKSHEDWEIGIDRYKELSVDAVQVFIDSLNKSTFVGLYPEGKWERLHKERQGHLFLEMKNGTTVGLRLIKGGYVKYEGTNGQIFSEIPLSYLDYGDDRAFQDLFEKITE